MLDIKRSGRIRQPSPGAGQAWLRLRCGRSSNNWMPAESRRTSISQNLQAERKSASKKIGALIGAGYERG